MKIIFLDIDGVINSGENMKRNHMLRRTCDDMRFDPNCMNALRRIVRETGAGLVLASTWRHPDIDSGSTLHISNLHQRLCDYGISVFDTTGAECESRGHEIDEWLSDHPDAEQYVILEDANDFYSYNRETHLKHLVLVDEIIGLTEQDADKAIGILCGRDF